MPRHPLVLFVALAAAMGARPAHAWTTQIGGSRFLVRDSTPAAAVDSRGDVVSVILSTGDPATCHVLARKQAGATGAVIWERSLGGCSYPGAVVAFDGHDDVVLALPGFVLTKLARRNGEVRWRTELEPTARWAAGYVSALAIDAAGDVIAAGTGVFNPFDDEDRDFLVQKLSGATGALAWRFSIGGEFAPCPPDEDDCHGDIGPDAGATAVAVDGTGRVFAAGGAESAAGGYDFIVVALNGPDGGEAWRYVRPGSFTGSAYAYALGAAGGALFAAGGDAAAGGAIVVRLDPGTGAEQWTSPLGGAAEPAGTVTAIRLHPSGDVVAAGFVGGFVSPPGGGTTFTVRLAAASGAVTWRQDVAAVLPAVSNVALASASDGSVTTCVSEYDWTVFPQPQRARVLRRDGDTGTLRWDVPFGSPAGEEGRCEAVATLGTDVVVAGAVRVVDTDTDATLARLAAADGAVVWRTTHDGIPGGDDEGSGVAVDAAGDLFVVGTVQNAYLSGSYEMAVVKLAPRTGEVRWRREIGGVSQYFAGAYDTGFDVAVDSAGNPIALGTIDNALYDFDAGVVKLDGATGTELWRTLLHSGEVHDRDFGFQVVVDAADRPVVLALLRDAQGRPIPWVISLDGATGAERWRRRLPLDPFGSIGVAGIALAPDGDVVAAGYTYDGLRQRFDTVAIAWDPASGTERWRRTLPGTQVSALAVDAHGRVALGGTISVPASWSDALVVLLDAATGDETARTAVTGPGSQGTVARLAWGRRGLVAAGIAANGDGFVARLANDGTLAWRRTVTASAGWVNGLDVGRNGAVVVAFLVRQQGGSGIGADTVLFGLSERRGTRRWRRILDGDAPLDDLDVVRDLVVTPRGDAVAVGITTSIDTYHDFTALAIRARTGRGRGDRLGDPQDRLHP